MATAELSRRTFLTGGGALVVGFGLPLELSAQSTPSPRSATPPPADQIDSWLAIGEDGRVTLYCGKVELGTGVETALGQIVAEELDVDVRRLTVVQGDTGRTPDQGYTVGSKTIQLGGPPIRQAAAEARQTLLALASSHLGAPAEALVVRDGVVSVKGNPARQVSYGRLIGGRRFERAVTNNAALKAPERYAIVGKPARRVDLPAKVTGTHVYVQNVRLPGMLHGRVVRPSATGAVLQSVDEASVAGIPGVVKVVTKRNFVGVVAEREDQAIQAARALKVTWQTPPPLPAMTALWDTIRGAPTTEKVLVNTGDVEAGLAGAARVLKATYRYPFQMHAAIGPSCAVADVRPDGATIWSGTQGPYPLRKSLANLLAIPAERVRVIFVEASGCYGHNGADDAAADAVLLSQGVGKPVRVQWMRHDEHGWEPKGPAMVMEVRAGLDGGGNVVAWDYSVWTPTHSTRPDGQPGNLLAGQLAGAAEAKNPFIGGDRNARHPYLVRNDRVTARWVAAPLLRSSALRGLGAPQNTFANESFLDELAAMAAVDPVQFRLRHLSDPRAIAVITAVAKLAGWVPRLSATKRSAGSGVTRGRGIAFAQYENAFAYVATIADVEVDRATGQVRVARVFVAHDCGLIINPDGLRNQIEGNVVQTISRALKEEVTFDGAGVTSLDWRSYPILTFPEVPERIEITLINHPEKPALGAGEPTACTIPAAIGNAIFDATGVRLRTAPFAPERVKEAL
jgi:CO/xanthine dehydrogenase Mo-binding subunit